RTGKLSSCFGARGDGTVVAGYEASPHRAWQPLERRTVRNPRRKRKPESRRACPRVGLGRMTFGGEEAARAAPYGRLERRSVNGSAFEWAPVSASWPSSHLSSDCSTNPRDCPRDAGCILVDHAGVGLFGATGGKRCAAT